MVDDQKLTERERELLEKQTRVEKIRRLAKSRADSESETAIELVFQRASEVKMERLRTLFGGRLVRGSFQLLVGPGEAGKGMVSARVIAHLTTGEPFPDTPEERVEAIDVVACVTEDSKPIVSRRLQAAGADLTRVLFSEGPPVIRGGLIVPSPVAFDSDAGRLAAGIIKHRAGALWLETTVEHLGDREGKRQWSTNNEAEVRRALAPIIAVCRETGVAGWGVMHPRKSMDGGIEDSISGSAAFRNVGRGVLHVYPDPTCDEEPPWRLLPCSKANYLRRKPPTLRFRIDPWQDDPAIGRVVWGIRGKTLEDPRNADEIWRQIRDMKAARRERRDYRTINAERMLMELLKDGQCAFARIQDEAKARSIPWRTVERAKTNLRIGSIKEGMPGKVTAWTMPDPEM